MHGDSHRVAIYRVCIAMHFSLISSICGELANAMLPLTRGEKYEIFNVMSDEYVTEII